MQVGDGRFANRRYQRGGDGLRGIGSRIREGKRGNTPIPVSSTGQALTFPHRGGREKMDSGFRRNDEFREGFFLSELLNTT